MDLSIVIPSYRSEKLVGRAIASAIAEGVRPHDIIVVEDSVVDATASVVAAFEGVCLLTVPDNQGAPHARNLGLTHVSTTYVMFLDADDYVENGLLRGLIEAARRQDSDLVIGPWVYEGEGRKRGMVRRPPDVPNDERIFHWLISAFFPPCCIAWKTESVRSIGGWDERLKKDQDGELMIRALVNGLRVCVSDHGNGVYWQHDSPFRVTRAKLDDVLYAAEVVFEQVEAWVGSNTEEVLRNRLRVVLGRYCCKMAWVAFSYGGDAEGAQWVARARRFGFGSKGYNYRSTMLASLFGIRLASKIKGHAGSVYRKRIAQR
jgi:glycosyltransferase involved in cell wall biosynthesis